MGIDTTPGGTPPPAPTGGGSSGGSSSGGSSGVGSSEPAVDPIVAQRTAIFQGIYERLWGEPAPKTYLEGFAKKGLNSAEFEEMERHKPAFRKSKAYKNEGGSWAQLLQSWGVV